MKVDQFYYANITCEPRLIYIITAFYGNKQFNCSSSNASDIIKNKCYLKNNCNISVSDKIFGNTCLNNTVPKYLYIEYNCLSK